MTWQPIETAPKDEPVLVCERGWRIEVAVQDKFGYWYSQPGRYGRLPTHWMPLPDSPAGGMKDNDNDVATN